MENSRARPEHGRSLRWWRGESGLETVEYALLAAVLLGAVIAAFPAIPTGFTDAYSAITDAIAAALGG